MHLQQRIVFFGCITLALLNGLISSSEALFDHSEVKHLNADQFTALRKSGNPILVKFFNEGCGHCRSFAPEYKKVAELLRGIVSVVAIDDRSVMASEHITGYPTVKFFFDKTYVKDYSGERTAKSLSEFVLNQLREVVNRRNGGKQQSKQSSSSSRSGGSDRDVVVLTDGNFENLVRKSPDDVWLVEFYAPWCGHCKALESTWNAVATELKEKVKVAKVDATTNTMLAKHFKIEGFPTIFLFPPGGDRNWSKLPSRAITYTEARSKDDIIKFAMAFGGAASKVVQLTEQDQLDDKCSTGVCIIAFLPHILDTNAKERNATLDIINKVIPTTASVPVKFFWSEGGSQFDLEEKLHLQFGFPAVVAINFEKKKFAVYKGQFQEDALRSFALGLMAGRVPVENLPADVPAIKKVGLWDGKDGALEEANHSDDEKDEL